MSCGSINIHTLDANYFISLRSGLPFSRNESVSCQTQQTIDLKIFCFLKRLIKLEEKE